MGAKQDIEALDSKISRLKVEYEQYFAGVLKREPLKLRGEINKTILFYTTQRITNTGLKFKFQNLVSKYNTFKQYWTRVLRAIEEGTYNRRAEGGMGPSLTPEKPPPTSVEQEPKVPAPETSDEAGGKDEVRALYEEFIDARKRCNEPTDGLSFEALEKTVETQKKKIESEYKTKDVDLKVYVKDGKAKIAIKPKKG